MPNTERIRVARRDPAELSDSQIEQLMGFGKRESDLIAELEAATRAGDRELAWQLAEALVRLEDEAARVREARTE
jgi:hypothetical protein